MKRNISLSDNNPTNGNGLFTLFNVLAILLLVTSVLILIRFDSYWGFIILFFLGGVCILSAVSSLDKERPARCYIGKDGKLDLTTPREYEAKKVGKYRALMGSFWWFHRKSQIVKFVFKDGYIYAEDRKGRSINAPLSELEISAHLDHQRGIESGAFTLTHGYQKLKVIFNDGFFETLEIEDMLQILSYAANVKETKYSKFNRAASNVSDLKDTLSAGLGVLKFIGSLVGDEDEDDDDALSLFGGDEEDDNENSEELDSENSEESEDDEEENPIEEEKKEKSKPAKASKLVMKMRHSSYDRKYANLYNTEKTSISEEDAKNPFKLWTHYLNALKEDFKSVIATKWVILTIIVCCPVCVFDGLGWWNIPVCLGIAALAYFLGYKTEKNRQERIFNDTSVGLDLASKGNQASSIDPYIHSLIDDKISNFDKSYRTNRLIAWILCGVACIFLAWAFLWTPQNQGSRYRSTHREAHEAPEIVEVSNEIEEDELQYNNQESESGASSNYDTIWFDPAAAREGDVVEERNSTDEYSSNRVSSATISNWVLKGKLGDYPVVFYLNAEGNQIKGKYAYQSTLNKYGTGPSSYFYLTGKQWEDGRVTLESTKYKETAIFERLDLTIDFYGSSTELNGTLTNANTGSQYPVNLVLEKGRTH